VEIVIKTTNLKLNGILRRYIEEKLNSLEKFSKIFYNEKCSGQFFGKGKPRIEVWVEVGKTSLHHQKGPVFFAECQMRFSGKSFRSVVRREDLKSAVAEAKNKLGQELERYKEKLTAKTKRRRSVK